MSLLITIARIRSISRDKEGYIRYKSVDLPYWDEGKYVGDKESASEIKWNTLRVHENPYFSDVVLRRPSSIVAAKEWVEKSDMGKGRKAQWLMTLEKLKNNHRLYLDYSW